ncbi:MAG: [FeFe] hydrogenase H-cluster radical SAM maturase HydG [Defluviitaleaceae bacterium]|nr:[FeFe] hydrogenase H-cluster radical SAM maturase HydG [Defluviitaleaceae bacterium]
MLPYNLQSSDAREFINHDEIVKSIAWAEENKDNQKLIAQVMAKAKEWKGLEHREAVLLLVGAKSRELFDLAGKIKQEFYGKRVVLFAPLYLSNYCVNGCVYCPYNVNNNAMPRKRLSQDDIRREVRALQSMGHKRIVIEAGEHPHFSPIDYVLESINTIYNSGDIRRINVNIAATTTEEYRRLKSAGIGTYILFQETYHEPTYKKLHPAGPKADYAWHTEAMDRAMQSGIDDVGIGALFGLADYRYELAALLMHSEHLEAVYGVGTHTISVPRIRKAQGVSVDSFEHGVTDEIYERIVACLRISAPYTGIIVSTRESEENRRNVLNAGVSQISGGSCTNVGGYSDKSKNNTDTNQFEISDKRSLGEIVHWLLEIGYIPSFCTACYHEGRVGDRFMELCKSGKIHNCCQPNALMTLQEYLMDYANISTKKAGESLINSELQNITSEKTRSLVTKYLEQIRAGRRDIRI